MSVETFDQPDFTSDSASEYKTKIDSAISIHNKVAGDFAPHEVSTPNMTVQVDAGKLFTPGGITLTEQSQQTSGTITAPSVNPRIDRIVIDSNTGAISIITGSEAASPSAPAITAGKLPIAQILLATSTTTITNSLITDERTHTVGSLSVVIPSGVMMAYGGTSAPTDWLLCYGQAISRTTYANLFSALGTAYGVGNGSTTFNVPDLRGRVPLGKDDMGGASADRVTASEADNLGESEGAEDHVLTEAELASHKHELKYSTISANAQFSATSFFALHTGATDYMRDATNASTDNQMVDAGSDSAHNNMQPYQTTNWIIKT